MSNKINKALQCIIDESTKELQEELKNTKQKYIEVQNKWADLTYEIEELKKITNQVEIRKEFNALLKPENFEGMLPFFNLKHNDFAISGMHSDEIPNWFKYLFHYYEDKDRLFQLMDLFEINYPEWAKDYKMPYDYNEEELNMFLDNMSNHYVCNGCIYKDNIGFFWERGIRDNCGNSKAIITYNSYTEIPWQLVLSNPLWTNNDFLFNRMIDLIKINKSNSDYFYAITNYINITDEQVLDLMEALPNANLYDVHKQFLTNNIHVFRGNAIFGEKFKDKINENPYSGFNYANFPTDIQKDYIRSMDGFAKKITAIRYMKTSDEEKIKFAMEFMHDKF